MSDRSTVVTLAASELADNRIRGAAAVMGNLDRQGDVILPGAFKRCIRRYLETGFVAQAHDWSTFLAMPVSMKEQGNALMAEAEFHSTDDAQALRQKCRERIERGLPVGLSVGFRLDPEGYAYFDTGAALLRWAEEAGYSLDLFDQPGIKARKGLCCAIREVAELYEFSIVPVPANPKAVATEVKSSTWPCRTEREFERHLRDAGFSRTAATAITLHGWRAAGGAMDEMPETEEPALRDAGLSGDDAARIIALRARALKLRVG